ncbi:MAG: high frequency lysogenization protein HflD, partial [Gammaproteobacteria bacterium]|nr:high frequency lysogenization protein HflD [Gammaproteobacteria bacterium]
AGVYQSAYLVHQIATRGMTDSAALEASINSVFKLDAPSTEAVFGDIGGVITGLSTLKRQLSEKHADTLQITQYVVTLLHLERKLSRQPALLEQIATGIRQAQQQAEHFSITHQNVLANLADTYKNTISTLTPRVLVQGEHGYLNNPDNANKVRAILLAGIRAAVLWSQCGGCC